MKAFVIYQQGRTTTVSKMMAAGDVAGFMKSIGVRQLVDGCKDPHPELLGRPTFEGFRGPTLDRDGAEGQVLRYADRNWKQS